MTLAYVRPHCHSTQCDQSPLFFQNTHNKRFPKLELFALNLSRELRISKYCFLSHFKKESIYIKVVLSSPNLTVIDQNI